VGWSGNYEEIYDLDSVFGCEHGKKGGIASLEPLNSHLLLKRLINCEFSLLQLLLQLAYPLLIQHSYIIFKSESNPNQI
jgi:hypothetical protein